MERNVPGGEEPRVVAFMVDHVDDGLGRRVVPQGSGYSVTKFGYGNDPAHDFGLVTTATRTGDDVTARVTEAHYTDGYLDHETSPTGAVTLIRRHPDTLTPEATVGPDGVAQVVREMDVWGNATVTQQLNVLTGTTRPEAVVTTSIAADPVNDPIAYTIRKEQGEHPPPDRSPRIGGSHVSDGAEAGEDAA